MGVTGLWKLIEQSGKPVPLETLENKVLAVDISIWLHQVVKGFQDNRGGTLPNAHLLGLFHRLCKLLFYKIKPVFVFDGGVPELKRETIARRAKNKTKYNSEAEKLHLLLLESLAKEKVVQQALGPSASTLAISPVKLHLSQSVEKDDMFKLPPLKEVDEDSNLDQSVSFTNLSSSESSFDEKSSKNYNNINLQDIDVRSSHFQGLPADIRHEILTDLKETRKQSSWGRLHELPAESKSFSCFQMKRLLKRRQVQVELEEAEKEIGGKSLSLLELESLLSEKGVVDPEIAKQRVTSNEHVRYLHVRDLKKALDKEAKDKLKEEVPSPSKVPKLIEEPVEDLIESDEDLELQRAIQLSLQAETDEVSVLEEEITDQIRVTRSQKKALGPAATCLARDFMVEYGGINDDEIKDLFYQNGDESCIDEREFRYNDSFIINGNSPDKKINISVAVPSTSQSQSQKSETIEISDASQSQKSNTIMISDASSDEGVSSDVDSDFVDVPDHEGIGVAPLFNSVAPLYMNKPAITDISKNFTLSDLKSKKIEVVIKPDLHQDSNDDIFADVFKKGATVTSKTEKSVEHTEIVKNVKEAEISDVKVNKMKSILSDLDFEMAEVKKISLDTIINLDDDDEAQSYPELKNDIIEIKSEEELSLDLGGPVSETTKDVPITEAPKEQIVQPKVLRTPSKTVEYVEELTPSKVPQPFFVKRTPSSKKKSESNNDKVSPRKVVKSLFETEPTKAISDEQDAVEMAANMLKESKSKEELESIASQLHKDRLELEMERNKRDRLGVSITDRMTQECMELLKLFGIPYIIAPMEAEAQCAFLNEIELTDGTITDDSDIWLFGGKTVYKNFFDQSKHVLEYKSTNIENLFHFDRKKLIQLSILVGSDYTPGIHGIGTVTALEVLATFNTTAEKEGETSEIMSLLSSLRKFRDWWQNKTVSARTTALRSKLKNITISEGFPSSRVVEAYMYPEVDKNKDKFTWGYPDEESIREFTRSSFGWTRKKTDDILIPVIKKMNEKISQQSIRNYFKITDYKSHKELALSKRVRKALDTFSNPIDGCVEENEASGSNLPTKTPKKRAKKAAPAGEEDETKLPKTRKRNAKTLKTKSLVIPDEDVEMASTSSASTSSSKVPRIPETNHPIPQREKDKAALENNKLKAINLLKNKKK